MKLARNAGVREKISERINRETPKALTCLSLVISDTNRAQAAGTRAR